MWGCLCSILELPVDQCDEGVRHTAALLLVLGGLGLRNAERTRSAAFWASWADCLPMVYARHPDVAIQLTLHLEGLPDTPLASAKLPPSPRHSREWVLKFRLGVNSCWEHAHRRENPMTTN